MPPRKSGVQPAASSTPHNTSAAYRCEACQRITGRRERCGGGRHGMACGRHSGVVESRRCGVCAMLRAWSRSCRNTPAQSPWQPPPSVGRLPGDQPCDFGRLESSRRVPPFVGIDAGPLSKGRPRGDVRPYPPRPQPLAHPSPFFIPAAAERDGQVKPTRRMDARACPLPAASREPFASHAVEARRALTAKGWQRPFRVPSSAGGRTGQSPSSLLHGIWTRARPPMRQDPAHLRMENEHR